MNALPSPAPEDAILHLGRHLRLDDNPLLASAAATRPRLLPVFALDPAIERGPWQEAFLLTALADLQVALRARGSDLLLLGESPPEAARGVYESPRRMIDDADLPVDPRAIPRVYTPFRLKVEAGGVRSSAPIAEPERLPPLPDGITCPTIVAPALPLVAEGGERSGRAHWQRYRDRRLPDSYKRTRNELLGWDHSSKLSPWLAWGCLSPRRLADDLARYEAEHGANEGTYWLWFEFLWRDFFSLRGDHRIGDASPVAPDDPRWLMLARARLGHPFIDAGLRELNATGFLGNRMRQIVASYCCHELGWPWEIGAAYFARQLIDHDPASNVGNWRAIAGEGGDRRGGRRFDIAKQREMYDPNDAYVRFWEMR